MLAKNYNPSATLDEACIGGTVAVGSVVLTNSIEIYPTLTTGDLFIESSKKLGACRVLIYDAIGRVVKGQDLLIENNKVHSIGLGEQEKGLYFVQIQSELGSYMERIIVY